MEKKKDLPLSYNVPTAVWDLGSRDFVSILIAQTPRSHKMPEMLFPKGGTSRDS